MLNVLIFSYSSFASLIKESDGDDYKLKKFNAMRVAQFKFFIITQNMMPSESLLEKTYPIRVIVGE